MYDGSTLPTDIEAIKASTQAGLVTLFEQIMNRFGEKHGYQFKFNTEPHGDWGWSRDGKNWTQYMGMEWNFAPNVEDAFAEQLVEFSKMFCLETEETTTV
jgi:hypothetical protein